MNMHTYLLNSVSSSFPKRKQMVVRLRPLNTSYKLRQMGVAGIIWMGITLAGLALGAATVGGELVFDVVAHGARGDGITDDTKAFEAAWAAACGAKGPSASVFVPAQRTFLVGPVSFEGPCATGRITVQVEGTIRALPKSASPWRGGPNDHWLMFSRVDALTLTGHGVLDGNGQSWWVTKRSDAVRVQSAPAGLKLVKCNNLELSGFRSKDSPEMHITIRESSGVTVRGLTITAPRNSPHTDGINVARSQGVRITDCRIGTGDDCVSLTTGDRFVTVDGVECGPGHGISIGSLGKNGGVAAVEYIDVRNVHFTNTTNGVRIKTWEGGQGYARSISFTNIEFTDVDNPVVIDQFYAARSVEAAVEISNVTYSNLRGTSRRPTAVAFDCSDGGSCKDIHVNSMMITGSDGRGTVARCRNVRVATSGQVYPEIRCSGH